jgi:hypothetical protein
VPARFLLATAYQSFGNGSESDCTLAAAANLVAIWHPLVNVVEADESVQAAWTALGAPTSGLVPDRVLRYWEHHAISGVTIKSFEQQSPTRVNIERDVVRDGGAYTSVDFGDLINKIQPSYTSEWTTSTDSKPIGVYHELVIIGYSSAGVQIVSWGTLYTATWGWVHAHVVDLDSVQR